MGRFSWDGWGHHIFIRGVGRTRVLYALVVNPLTTRRREDGPQRAGGSETGKRESTEKVGGGFGPGWSKVG